MDKVVKDPFVSVLMPVFNGELYIREAIDSILKQTYTHFEFLIINDGSTDRTVEIIKSYNDSRIKQINNKENIGLTKSLNIGLKLAKGKYIARMDADDISSPLRLEKQIQFLEHNTHVGLVGSWFKIIDKDVTVKTLSDPEEIHVQLLFKNPIAHPTTMYRKKLLTDYNLSYNTAFNTSQDNDLWYRFSKVTKLCNLPEVLVYYRKHENQISEKNLVLQKNNSRAIQQNKISDFLGFEVPEEQTNALEKMYSNQSLGTNDFILITTLLNSLKKRNNDTGVFNRKKLSSYLNRLLKLSVSRLSKQTFFWYFLPIKAPTAYWNN